MAKTGQDRRIDYIEFNASDIGKVKAFYSAAFGWNFTDYGPDYTAFEDGRMNGGFAKVADEGSAGHNPLVVLYADDLARAAEAIRSAGGTVQEQVEFPGGRRFYFLDPVGNRLAIWTDQ
ncbi:MAG TPA: VOC family protein [Gemmatimonadales bacterium]|jgi:hypothetical protein|nr:VOC family protein [Gemmatimonadales bacterium]